MITYKYELHNIHYLIICLFVYSTSAMSLLYECINTVIAGKYIFVTKL